MGKNVLDSKPPIRLWGLSRSIAHQKQCSKSHGCSKCVWAKKGKRLQVAFPWLRFGRRLDTSTFGLGCSVCCRYAWHKKMAANGRRAVATPCRALSSGPLGKKSEFEEFTVPLRTKIWHLNRHQETQKHQEAMKWEAGHATESELLAGPSTEEFDKVLNDMRRGQSMRDVLGGSASDRSSFMRYCLSEALLDLNRERCRTAATLCVTRDERKGRLLIKFRACGWKSLKVFTVVLGMPRLNEGASAEDLVSATAKALRRFCYKNFSPPRMGKKLVQSGGFDLTLFKEIREKIHILCTDAHPAELLASNIMSGKRKSGKPEHNESVFLPNIVLVGRDHAHASTRLVKRPWACIPAIQDRVELLLLFLFFECLTQIQNDD